VSLNSSAVRNPDLISKSSREFGNQCIVIAIDANRKVIKKILEQAYPSGKNIDKELIEILYQPSQRKNSKEAFRGFINLFDDYLATDLFGEVVAPLQLIWGEKDPWESLKEAKKWKRQFKNIKRLDIIKGAGHCPHDEEPDKTNKLINEFIQETK